MGWKYHGTYDEDTVCDILTTSDAFVTIGGLITSIIVDDITGVGVLDDALIPVTIAGVATGAAVCTLEDIAEEYLSGYLNCPSQKWVYELYVSKFYNSTAKPIIVPICA